MVVDPTTGKSKFLSQFEVSEREREREKEREIERAKFKWPPSVPSSPISLHYNVYECISLYMYVYMCAVLFML